MNEVCEARFVGESMASPFFPSGGIDWSIVQGELATVSDFSGAIGAVVEEAVTPFGKLGVDLNAAIAGELPSHQG